MKVNRILVSVASLCLVYSLLGSTALALFLPQVSLTGMQLSTSTLGLLVGTGDNPTYVQTGHLAGVSDLHPGMTPFTDSFWLQNTSSTMPLDLSIQMEGGSSDWEQLKNLIQIQIRDVSGNHTSPWFSLAEITDASFHPLPNFVLPARESRQYEIVYDFPATYPLDPDGSGPLQAGDPIGNEMMDKSTNDMQIIFEGKAHQL
jgi:hypothetical protein